MVAYSFKRRFVAPIKVGLGAIEHIPGTEYVPKRQTIRADRKRHARPGEELQLYAGMRTKQCFLIGRARCKDVRDILITLKQIGGCVSVGSGNQRFAVYQGEGLGDFARADGFDGWASMVKFWKDEHGDIETFIGVLIEWEPLK